MKSRIPINFTKMRKGLRRNITGWPGNQGRKHISCPKDPELSKKLSIKPNSKILFVAGFSGEWARNLAQDCQVKFTDAGKGMVGNARRRYKDKMTYSKAIAQIMPQRSLKFDWTVSFEPFPLGAQRGFILSSIRSLLNKKGYKLIIRNKDESEHFWNIFKSVAKIYSSKATQKTIKIITDDSPEGRTLIVHTLQTNNVARQRAQLDLKVLRNIERKDYSKIGIEEIRQISIETRLSESTVRASIKRLNQLIAQDDAWFDQQEKKF